MREREIVCVWIEIIRLNPKFADIVWKLSL
jgi:hypothetical protein